MKNGVECVYAEPKAGHDCVYWNAELSESHATIKRPNRITKRGWQCTCDSIRESDAVELTGWPVDAAKSRIHQVGFSQSPARESHCSRGIEDLKCWPHEPAGNHTDIANGEHDQRPQRFDVVEGELPCRSFVKQARRAAHAQGRFQNFLAVTFRHDAQPSASLRDPESPQCSTSVLPSQGQVVWELSAGSDSGCGVPYDQQKP